MKWLKGGKGGVEGEGYVDLMEKLSRGVTKI